MEHTYTITGMTCGGCEAKVKNNLLSVPGITSVEVSRQQNTALIGMSSHVPLLALQTALGGAQSKYHISAMQHSEAAETAKSWLATYRPVLLIFAVLLVLSFSLGRVDGQLSAMLAMRIFMGGFFLLFSLFKMLDLRGFAESYAMYDVVAKRFPAWGSVYPFVEAALGLAFISGFAPVATNITTLVVMSVSLVGVLQSVLNKRAIRCACLGTAFKLPMSTVTIIEDGLMIVMSIVMLYTMF